jgi:hypothetical protein
MKKSEERVKTSEISEEEYFKEKIEEIKKEEEMERLKEEIRKI